MLKSYRHISIVLLAIFGLVAFQSFAVANHAWGSYHWARTSNPFTLKLGDNVNNTWQPFLEEASDDWSQSSVLNTTVVAGSTRPRSFKAVTGRVEVCNASYGNNGWLGIAGIYASGNHITKGYVKVNDYYHNNAPYNSSAWRQFVMCQEIGHTLGLGHQDEDFDNANLGTCMDYGDPTGDPAQQNPDQHDYNQLETIYAHLDSTTTVGSKVPDAMNRIEFQGPGQWGKLIHQSKDGRISLYMLDFGNGHKVFHFVTWATPRKADQDSH